jgi:hypothetical protein
MANEITITLQTLLRNGGLSDNHSSGSIAVDQASAKVLRNVQTIGTVQEALVLGDITTPGYCVFINLDITNFVEIGVTGSMFLKLKPGEQAICRLTTTAPFAKADTASVELFYIMYED